MEPWMKRMRVVGIGLAFAGTGLFAAGLLYGLPQAEAGLDSAQAMYEAQGVELAYDAHGRLLDRGTPEGAQAILQLLKDDFDFPLDEGNLDPGDPLVDTRDEVMYQYAVIVYHVLHATHTVTLTEDQVPITYRGVEYVEPGDYSIEVGAYYAQLDRTHPIEGQLRNAWSPLALSLTGTLAAAHANHATGEVARMMSLAVAGIGALTAAAGGGLVWVAWVRAPDVPAAGRPPRPVAPARLRTHRQGGPEDMRLPPPRAP